jgi:hypothetical protein
MYSFLTLEEISKMHMKKIRLGFALLFAACLTQLSVAGSPKAYPGASEEKELTQKANEAAKSMGSKSKTKVYSSSDDFEKIKKFYAAQPGAKESDLGETAAELAMVKRMLPPGQKLNKAYFIFDGAADISVSHNWVAIQFPLIGGMKLDSNHKYTGVRQVTSIQFVEN